MDGSSDESERRRMRAERISVTIVRPGAPAPRERAIVGAPSISLATELTAMAYSLAGIPPRSIPRAEWPVVRRTLHER